MPPPFPSGLPDAQAYVKVLAASAYSCLHSPSAPLVAKVTVLGRRQCSYGTQRLSITCERCPYPLWLSTPKSRISTPPPQVFKLPSSLKLQQLLRTPTQEADSDPLQHALTSVWSIVQLNLRLRKSHRPIFQRLTTKSSEADWR